MKQFNDNHVFWGVIFLFIGFYYIIRELPTDRFLVTHWVRVGFFLILGLRKLFLPFWQRRSHAALIRENDELEHLHRLKAARAAMWASLLPLLILGTLLDKWGGSENVELIGLGLWLSPFFILAIFRIVPALYVIMNASENGGKP